MLAPVRILCVGNIYPPQAPGGGYELTWQSCVRHLRARGHDVRVLASDHSEAGVDEPDEGDVHRELRWYLRDHDFPRLPLREVIGLERWNARVLRRHLDEFAPDVVSWWGMGGMSMGLVERVRRARVPAVGVVEDEWLNWGPRVDGWTRLFRHRPRAGWVAERFTGLPTRPQLGDAALWVFCSDHTERRAHEEWGIPDRRVARLGIDDQLFQKAEPRPWRWQLLYLGRMDPRKGVDVAVDALAHLPDEARLVLQGRGDERYIEELKRAGASRVSFSQRPRNELPGVYAEADVVLFPVQWEEPWGLVPLEAMAVGRPVVATGTGGGREYFRHEQNCLIYEPRDSPEALAAAVRRLAEDPELRERLRVGGFETAACYTEHLHNEAVEAALLDWAGSTAGLGERRIR